MVVRRQNLDLDAPLPASAVPLLVVEVLSPSNQSYDLGLKRHLYERLAVPAYWVIDPSGPSVVALRNRGRGAGGYQVEAEVAGQEVWEADWPFAVRVVPDELGA